MVSRLAAGAWILPLILTGWLTGETSEALTTFGKTSNTQNLPPPSPTPPPGRECNKQSECAGIAGTSCVRTGSDLRTRCLCGDNISPVNGRCSATLKWLRHLCQESTECADTMICAVPNITQATPASNAHRGTFQSVQQLPAGYATGPSDKICVCDEEGGYTERDFYCNDAVASRSSMTALFISLLVLATSKCAT